MAYKSLYRSYRPQQFSEVIGQQHIVQTLKNAIARDQLAHAYLFTGSRGTGKTTIAKILAKGINCLNPQDAPCNHCEMCEAINQESHPDIIEIDAASNNSVDDVRDLIERVKYAPLQAKKKVYIIDEVHMLTTGAFNALLKTLEEPPEHVVFILATTEVHKVLPTIISRCQRYDFTRISNKEIIKNLERVIEGESLKVEEGVVELIANLADGGHRDSLTILEQAIAYSKDTITLNDLNELYRISTPQDKKELIETINNNDLVKGLELLDELENKSIDYKRYLFDFITLCKETLVYSLTQNLELVSNINRSTVKALVELNQNDLLIKLSNEMLSISQEARLNGQYQSYLEVMLINLIKPTQLELSLVDKDEKMEVNTENTESNELKKVTQEPIKTNLEQVEEVEVDKKSITIQETDDINKTQVNSEEDLSDDQVIELMVLGNKQVRADDTEAYRSVKLYLNNLKYRRLNFLLNNSFIGVSNKEFVVLVVENPNDVISLNEETNKNLLHELVNDVIEARKVFVVDAKRFNEITKEFMVKYQNKELPDPNQIQIDFSIQNNETEEVKDPETLLREVFGEIRVED